MKKILLVLSIVLVTLIFNEDKVDYVFNEDLELENLYEITFINNLSTNNFLNYFNDIKVIWIKPKNNIIYQGKLKKYNTYYFKEIPNHINIENFKCLHVQKINDS